MPQIVILAGPNGAGKSTLATRLVPPGVPFLNADNIARALAPAPGQNADLAAGRLLRARMDEPNAGHAHPALAGSRVHCITGIRLAAEHRSCRGARCSAGPQWRPRYSRSDYPPPVQGGFTRL